MDGLDRIERHDEVSRILDVDHQLRSAVRCDLTHRAEHLTTVDRKYLISYRNLFAHDVVLQHSYSWTWHAYSITADPTRITMYSQTPAARRALFLQSSPSVGV
jgi:hypothetical protein